MTSNGDHHNRAVVSWDDMRAWLLRLGYDMDDVESVHIGFDFGPEGGFHLHASVRHYLRNELGERYEAPSGDCMAMERRIVSLDGFPPLSVQVG
jgi:hypothetical protein